MRGIHGEKKPHKCSICDYVTAQKRHLREHVNLAHDQNLEVDELEVVRQETTRAKKSPTT